MTLEGGDLGGSCHWRRQVAIDSKKDCDQVHSVSAGSELCS